MYYRHPRGNIVGQLLTAIVVLLAWVTVKCWSHMRQRSPDWRGPTIACALTWLVVWLFLRSRGSG